jgi:hypothetical protein
MSRRSGRIAPQRPISEAQATDAARVFIVPDKP